MSILRQIDFSGACGRLEKGADALNDVERDLRNVVRPQPIQNGSPLERDRQRAQLFHGKIDIV